MTSTSAARRSTTRRRGPASSRRARGVARGPEARIARGLTLVVSVLCIVGVLMVYSSSTVASINGGGSPFGIIAKQLGFLTVGAIGYVMLARFDYRLLRRLAFPALVVGIVLLVLVFIPQLGRTENDAHRWLGFGFLQFQPSEVVKLPLALFLAAFLTARERDGSIADWRRTAAPIAIVVGIIAGLMLLEPDFDGTLVMLALVGGVLLIAAVPGRWLAAGAIAAALAALAALTVPVLGGTWRRARLLVFVNPWPHAQDTGYQSLASFSTIALGGWTGVGLGNGTAKWGFLPIVYSDFVFAAIAEELGFGGCLVVVACYAVFGILGFRAALHAPDRFGTLLAVGLTLTVLVQATINIGMVVGILPVSGLTLPFVSYGGTSLIFMLAAAGVLQNIARQAKPRAAR